MSEQERKPGTKPGKVAVKEGTFDPVLGKTVWADVLHDARCAIFAGTGPCDCEPEDCPPHLALRTDLN